MEDGYKAIETIEAGDRVYLANEELQELKIKYKLGPFTTLVHGTLLPYDKKRFTPHITVIRKAEYRNGRFLSWKLPEAV